MLPLLILMDGEFQVKANEGLLSRVCIDMYYTYKYILHLLFVFKMEFFFIYFIYFKNLSINDLI